MSIYLNEIIGNLFFIFIGVFFLKSMNLINNFHLSLLALFGLWDKLLLIIFHTL